LKQQGSLDAFRKAVTLVKEAPPHLEGSIQKLVSTATANLPSQKQACCYHGFLWQKDL
jgi:hypothetical protein